MKKIFRCVIVTIIFSLIFFTNFVFAETKTFIKEYSYQASEEDSKSSSRTIALREVKRLLLEELGVYLENITEVKNFQLTQDQITTLTAGIVKTVLLAEKWDGHTYWLKAKVTAETSEVIRSIDTLRKDRAKTMELEDVRRQSDELLKENARLRAKLPLVKNKEGQKNKVAYDKTTKELMALEWFEKGYSSVLSGNGSDGIVAYSRAIELNPFFAIAYYNRGTAYTDLGNYEKGIDDLSRAIEIAPNDASAYHNRGVAYVGTGNYDQAIKDYNKAIEIAPKLAAAYSSRGGVYFRLGIYNRAIEDSEKAIALNPRYEDAYNNLCMSYHALGSDNRAIENCDKAIELNPNSATAFNNRGVVYGYGGNDYQGTNDLKMAARLGHKGAQDVLRRRGISW